jgi:homoserine acetyltransferase
MRNHIKKNRFSIIFLIQKASQYKGGVFYKHFDFVLFVYIIQTLATFDIGGYQIGDQGIRRLADALRQNKVTSLTSFFLSHYLFNYLYF